MKITHQEILHAPLKKKSPSKGYAILFILFI